jgi:hypothetical protein
MLYTIMNYSCTSETNTDGSPLYKIDATVSDKGSLPYQAVFVYNIVKSDRISSDTFARVATPHDMQVLSPDRYAAVRNRQTQYLSNGVTLTYPAIDLAAQAKVKLTERINALALGWVQYTEAFAETDGSYAFPNTAQSVNDELKLAYQLAVKERGTAALDLTAAIAEVSTTQVSLNHAQDMVDAWYYSVAFLTKDSTPDVDVDGDKGFVPLLGTYHRVLLTGIDDEPEDAAAIWDFGDGTVIPDINDYSAHCKAQLTYWRTQRDVYRDDYNTAITSRIEKEAALKAAEKKETGAKADILTVCPSFDFSSI